MTEGATETELTSAEFSVDTLADLTEDLMSISIVTDYSGSMRDADIDNAALIYTDLFTALPSIYEAEAIVFSDEVTLQQTFTEDQTTILSAVARDDSIERSSTALYDGMGTALGYLTERTRPIKLLVTATDGLENASATYSKSQITSTISDNGVIVVMIGSLFSDVDELSDLAGSNGIYFFAQTYTEARTAMTTFISSLENIVRITVDNTYQNADTISVAIGSNTATFSFSD